MEAEAASASAAPVEWSAKLAVVRLALKAKAAKLASPARLVRRVQSFAEDGEQPSCC